MSTEEAGLCEKHNQREYFTPCMKCIREDFKRIEDEALNYKVALDLILKCRDISIIHRYTRKSLNDGLRIKYGR